MHLKIDPYWLDDKGVSVVRDHYGGIFMGYWCIKNPDDSWSEQPVDVFYQPNPDTSKGHTNYFGIFRRDGKIFITNASSAFSVPIYGIHIPLTDEVIVSRYRHDYVSRSTNTNSYFIDGGRDYTRRSLSGDLVQVVVEGSKFSFKSTKDLTNGRL